MILIRYFVTTADLHVSREYVVRWSQSEGLVTTHDPHKAATFGEELSGYHRAGIFLGVIQALTPQMIQMEISTSGAIQEEAS